ncbi:hypothetical protein [Marinobacter aromaticivorans]|uniref:Uncharacterized protein n=1 Tax=Marinobacter aromaticivorans TaxID=1494078 RepID=A0ABW2IQR1_9GAMM|nr:hypothetical protein [Marinobacter aromaticivorans]
MELTSRTPSFAPVIIAGALMGGASGAAAMETEQEFYDALPQVPYVDISDGTYAANTDYLSSVDAGRQFEGEVKKLFDRFASEQTTLGAEFEEVLHKNLWDMYTRS